MRLMQPNAIYINIMASLEAAKQPEVSFLDVKARTKSGMMVCGQHNYEIKSEVAFHSKTLVNERYRTECLIGIIPVLSKSVSVCGGI